MADRPNDCPLAMTLGEPAGIGPDITALAWLRRYDARLPAFYVLGPPGLIEARVRRLGLPVPIEPVGSPAEAVAAFATALPVWPVGADGAVEPGRPDARWAPTVLASIETAVAHTLDGRAAALVTNPIAKHVLYEAGFAHPGHTELLAELARQHGGRPLRPVMMLACDELKVVPLTIHIPLAAVPGALTTALVVETGRIVALALQRDFAIPEPRIAVCGLNPHAGESGTIGREDLEIIAPALETLRIEGHRVIGPLSADTMFHAAARARYDAAIAMYHDQALIPIKTLAFDSGVNVTLGLPFVRTSPDHGTAFDIAGTGTASPTSLIEALRMAAHIARNRARVGA